MKIVKAQKVQALFATGIRRLHDDGLTFVTGGHKNDAEIDLVDADARIDSKIKL